MQKIDFVVPMVFTDDPKWRFDFLRLGRCYNNNAYYSANWRSWGMERLLIKAIRRFMPWVNKIHLLLAYESQVRDWMGDEDVNIVFHKDYIPGEFLPTFNSNTIEVFLNRIPGLAEKFIYGNDDVFPLSPLREEQFFSFGLPCQHYVERSFPNNPSVFEQFCQNGLNMVAADFGKHYTDKWLKGHHSLSPYLKTTLDRVWELHENEILSSITPERATYNHNQYIFAYYQHFTSEYVDKMPSSTMLSVAMPLEDIVGAIRSEDAGIVCINDHTDVLDFELYRDTIYKTLRQKIGID